MNEISLIYELWYDIWLKILHVNILSKKRKKWLCVIFYSWKKLKEKKNKTLKINDFFSIEMFQWIMSNKILNFEFLYFFFTIDLFSSSFG